MDDGYNQKINQYFVTRHDAAVFLLNLEPDTNLKSKKLKKSIEQNKYLVIKKVLRILFKYFQNKNI